MRGDRGRGGEVGLAGRPSGPGTQVVELVVDSIYELVSLSDELLPAAVAADVTQLAGLYTAASHCGHIGRAEDAVRYAQAAVRLQDDPGGARYLLRI